MHTIDSTKTVERVKEVKYFEVFVLHNKSKILNLRYTLKSRINVLNLE